MKRNRVKCPGCGRMRFVQGGRFETHQIEAEPLGYCFMSGMPQPVTGRRDADMETRAQIVACLAVEVQDADPVAVWRYLEVVPEQFVRELLQLALAALPVEGKRVEDIWERWGVA